MRRAGLTSRVQPDCCRPGVASAPFDNAVVESVWARMQVELLNRRRWNTRVNLANAIFEYIEGFHNRRRRHPALGWQTPLDVEQAHQHKLASPHSWIPENRGKTKESGKEGQAHTCRTTERELRRSTDPLC